MLKRFFFFALLLFSCTVLPESSHSGEAAIPMDRKNMEWPTYRPYELLVRIKHGTDSKKLAALHLSLEAKPVKKLTGMGVIKIRVNPETDIDGILQRYRASGLVLEAERHAVRYPLISDLPNDTFVNEQWGLDSADAVNAWKIGQGSQSTVVAIIDTGIDYNHPNLQQNIWINMAEQEGMAGIDDDGNGYVDDIHGYDFADDDPHPMDYSGHGTHVAGIIGAAGNNGSGVTGICWDIQLMPLKVQRNGSSDFDLSHIIDAVEYARQKGVRIFNCSYGGPSYSAIEFAVLDTIRESGGLIICAAGNNGVDIDSGNALYPAGYDLDNIIAVAAIGSTGELCEWSNYGAASVDLAAPGADILSTVPVYAPTMYSEIRADSVAYAAIGMTFAGITDEAGILGQLMDCGYGYPEEIPAGIAGNIALVKRGCVNSESFYFHQKISNVQSVGGIGVIIYNNVPGNFEGTLGILGDWIPAVSISQEDGQSLLPQLPLQIRLINNNRDDPTFYGKMSGTSMATPFVSGLAGLILSRNPSMSCTDIRHIILDNAEPIASAAGKTVSGGRINLFDALGAMLIPGDLTGDDRLELDDLIISQRILSGIDPGHTVVYHPETSDIDHNGKIGLEETLYILKQMVEAK